MKKRLCLLLVVVLLILSLSACRADMDIGNNTALGEQFMTSLIEDDYAAACALLKNTASEAEISEYWKTIRPFVAGATTYELEQIGWRVSRDNGQTTRTTAYQVYLDNGNIALLRLSTIEGVEGIAGIHTKDVTGFVTATKAFLPGMEIVLSIISLSVCALTVWALIDCAKRRIKRKVLWLILIVCGVAFTITMGEQNGITLALGLMLQFSTVVADPSTLTVAIKCILPVGTIVYLCLRKRLTALPPVTEEDAPASDLPVAENNAVTAAAEAAEPTSEENP